MWIVDAAQWGPLSVARHGFNMRLQKPIVGQNHVQVAETSGNEGVVMEYTIMRVEVDVPDGVTNPEWYLPQSVIRECFLWIRVGARQYWLGVLMGGTDQAIRGSIIDQDGSYTNFAASKTPIIISPLSEKEWHWIGAEMAQLNVPSIPEVLFCDALLAMREGDFLQSVIRLGVTCELELNAFIEDLLGVQSESVRRLYSASRPSFDWKLKNMPEILGAEAYQAHNAKWTQELSKLYELRGTAIHRAECSVMEQNPVTGKNEKIRINFGHVSTFMYAVGDFLSWTKQQRQKRGIPAVVNNAVGIEATLGSY